MNTDAAIRLRRRLKREHKSQNALAAELGISKAHLSQILTGKRQPSLGLALRLESVTGIPARDFADEEAALV